MANTTNDVASAVQLITGIEQKTLIDTKTAITTAIDQLTKINADNILPVDYRSTARDICVNVTAFLSMQLPGLDSHIIIPLAPESEKALS